MTSIDRMNMRLVEQKAASSPLVIELPSRSPMMIIWRKRWWILIVAALGIVVACAYLADQKPLFASSSRLLIQSGATRAATVDAIPSQQWGINTACEVIKSTGFLETVLQLPQVRQLEMIQNADVQSNAIKENLIVTPAINSDVVTITVESPSAQDASVLVNAIVQAYINFVASQRHLTARETLDLFQKEKSKFEAEVNEKRRALLAFKEKHGILSFQDERGNLILQSLAKISEALTTARIETIDARAAYDGVEALSATPQKLLELARAELPRETVVNVDHDANESNEASSHAEPADALQTALYQAEEKLTRLLRDHDEKYPDVREARQDIEWIKRQIARRDATLAEEQNKSSDRQKQLIARRKQDQAWLQQRKDKELVDGYVAGIARKLAVCRQREAELAKAFEEQKKLAFDLNATAAQYAAMEGDLSQVSRLYESLKDRIATLNVNDDTAGQVNVGILDVGRPELSPVKPEKARILGLGLVLGLALGIGAAFGLEAMDQRITSVDEVTSLLDSQVLGLVPHVKGANGTSIVGRKTSLDPSSDVAEAFRTIRTAICFGSAGEIRKLLVTSPSAGDGKTTSASNLAIAMAQAGRRVALVDCDLRRPTLQQIFNIKPSGDLVGVIKGETSLAEARCSTGIERLDLIACKSIPANPSELLNTVRFASVMEELAATYDLLVLDSPPLGPVTDASILAVRCDATLLVLRADQSRRNAVAHARDRLRSVGALLCGVVINDVPRRHELYRYHYGYAYGGYRSYKGKNGNGNGNGAHEAVRVSEEGGR